MVNLLPLDENSESSSPVILEGWGNDPFYGGVFRGHYVPARDANRLLNQTDDLWVIETVTSAFISDPDNPKGDKVGQKDYFVYTLSSALGLAARIQIENDMVSETVVAVRRAKKTEITMYEKALAYFFSVVTPILSDKQVSDLPEPEPIEIDLPTQEQVNALMKKMGLIKLDGEDE
jgi:hypothetical protein